MKTLGLAVLVSLLMVLFIVQLSRAIDNDLARYYTHTMPEVSR